MPARTSGRHALVLSPAALLLLAASAPWGGAAAPTTEPTPDATSPSSPTVPTDAIEAPASVPGRGVVAPGARNGVDAAVESASISGIPDAALAAYQRAETVINAADKSCNIPWQLIAAIGRVESDHGRANGNTLNDQGLATPGIFGIPLDGSNNTSVIRDTDAGQYDSDAKWDRAVGPMQFIPSTWSVVGVDGDNDGQRDPQDIDDAALATAVYLCSGNDDLSTEIGRRPAIFRYNHSHHYVDLVLSLMDAYLDGDYTSVPNVTAGYAGTFVAVPAPVPAHPGRGPSLRSELVRPAGDVKSELVDPSGAPAGSHGGGKGPLDSEVVTDPDDTEEPTPTPGPTPEPEPQPDPDAASPSPSPSRSPARVATPAPSRSPAAPTVTAAPAPSPPRPSPARPRSRRASSA